MAGERTPLRAQIEETEARLQEDKINLTRENTRARLWLSKYLDESDPSTFFRPEAAVRAAGYDLEDICEYFEISDKLLKVFSEDIDRFLASCFEPAYLKRRLIELMSATETKFFSAGGEVTAERTVPDYTVRLNAVKTAAIIDKILSENVNCEIDGNGKVTINVIAVDKPAEDVDNRQLQLPYNVFVGTGQGSEWEK